MAKGKTVNGNGNYQAREFANRAGITVRTLHHYDRLGLLKPARTHSGYRVYREHDFVRLGQIVTLKFIGFPLKQIRGLLDRHALDLPSALRLQRKILQDKRAQLDKAIQALSYAEHAVARGSGAEALRKVTEAIEMTNSQEWTNKYYNEEAKRALAQRRQENPGIAEQGTRDWAALIADVEQAVKEKVDPASARAQKLAERWSGLIHSFTQGNKAVEEGLKKLYSDQKNWPATFRKPYSDEAQAFICAAQAARKP